MSAAKRNKLCPYKRLCRDTCYGENPCAFAKAFDGLQEKIDRLKAENQTLRAENEDLSTRLDNLLDPDFCDSAAPF